MSISALCADCGKRPKFWTDITCANTCDNLYSYTIVLKCAGSCDSDVVLVIVIITLYPKDTLALYFTLFR